MKLLSLLLPLLATTQVLAQDTQDTQNQEKTNVPDEKKQLEQANIKLDDAPHATTFNSIDVPPIPELTSQNFDDTIKEGFWFIKYYSPYCPFCVSIIPTWQTLYELYTTSKPTTPSTQDESLNTFTDYYNFRFASLNCVEYADKCLDQGITMWPTFALYNNSQLVTYYYEKKDMEGLSQFLEEKLNVIRPDSRPAAGTIKLPEPGANSSDPLAYNITSTETLAANASDEIMDDLTQSSVATIPNEKGTSVPLTAETFQKHVTITSDLWFIKFYAPWCPHCQAMGPSWHHMAKAMKGKLNVGEVNCDVERMLCKDAKVDSYPTIYFFRGGEKVEYNGLRGYGDLLQVSEKAVDIVGKGITDVNEESFDQLAETDKVLFLYFYDHATTSEDFTAMNRLTLSLVNHAKLVKTSDPALAKRFKIGTFPRLMCYREGKTNYYSPLSPKEMRDLKQIVKWMKSVWLPLVPELSVANANDIMNKKYAVLGILNRQRNDEFTQDTRELKNAALEWMEKQTKLFQMERQELRDAKQLRIEEAEDRNDQRALRAAKGVHINIREDDRKQVTFAWVDGQFWQRWLKTTYGVDIKAGERVIIADEENNRYWDSTTSGAPIMPSRTSILETLSHIVNSPEKLRAKSTVGPVKGTVLTVRTFLGRHPLLLLFTFIATMMLISMSLKGNIRKTRSPGGSGSGGVVGGLFGGSPSFPGAFSLDSKDGMPGNAGNGGKVD